MSENMTAERAGELERDIGIELGVLARMLRNSFDRQVSSLNVTRSQWAMIAVVARNSGATQRVIAEALEMSEASAGRLIDRLCADGLLERQERYDDRRARAVYLTKLAEPLLAKLAEIARQGEQRIFHDFSQQELISLKCYLDRIYKNVS
ncbi:MAG: MarR family transcriptional regulator [Novosphingobium sp.]